MIFTQVKNRIERNIFKNFGYNDTQTISGEWKEGAYVPECFTEVPPHCVLNGRLFFLKSTLYIYYPENNYWRIVKGLYNNPNLQRVNALLTYDSTLFLIGKYGKIYLNINIIFVSLYENF